VNLQVDKVVDAFNHLENLKQNDWSERVDTTETNQMMDKTIGNTLKSNKPKESQEFATFFRRKA